MISAIRCAFPRAFISNRGMTILEVMVSVVIASAGLVGLSIVYLFGWDTWNKTMDRMLIQQEGTRGLEVLTEKLQGAGIITSAGNEITIQYPVPDNHPRPSVTIRLSDGRLFVGEEQVVPAASIDTALKVAEFSPPQIEDSLCQVKFTLRLRRRGYTEQLEFATTLNSRNIGQSMASNGK